MSTTLAYSELEAYCNILTSERNALAVQNAKLRQELECAKEEPIRCGHELQAWRNWAKTEVDKVGGIDHVLRNFLTKEGM